MSQTLSLLIFMAILFSWLHYYNLSAKIGSQWWTLISKATFKAWSILKVSPQTPLQFIEKKWSEGLSAVMARICVFLRISGTPNWRIMKSPSQRLFWPGSPMLLFSFPQSAPTFSLDLHSSWDKRWRHLLLGWWVALVPSFQGIPCTECISVC